jgi:hypothetical protein
MRHVPAAAIDSGQQQFIIDNALALGKMTLSMTVDPTGALNCDRELSARFGSGLTETAALDFGLNPGTPVGGSLIDAHAGGLGAIGGEDASGATVDVCNRLALCVPKALSGLMT